MVDVICSVLFKIHSAEVMQKAVLCAMKTPSSNIFAADIHSISLFPYT